MQNATMNDHWKNTIRPMALDAMGGKCIYCGYNSFPSSLCFHHLVKSEKEFCFDKKLFVVYDNLVNELDKCVLLCHNCHHALHNKKIDINNVVKLDKTKLSPVGYEFCERCNRFEFDINKNCEKTKIYFRKKNKRDTDAKVDDKKQTQIQELNSACYELIHNKTKSSLETENYKIIKVGQFIEVTEKKEKKHE